MRRYADVDIIGKILTYADYVDFLRTFVELASQKTGGYESYEFKDTLTLRFSILINVSSQT